ncbi:sigma-70 family RNA polymerase sigma factor [candidate division GN15 bacterium]|nr:sigma-70 family RNA polymerase sigma factor [candidate division GN15 bacterium]
MAGERKTYLAELVERCRADDQAGWQELIDLVTPVILSVCRRMKLSQEEALDIYGQVCYLLLDSLHQLRSPDKLFGYTASITRHEVLSHYRRSRLFADSVDDQVWESLTVSEAEQEATLEAADQAEILMQALGRLSHKEYLLIKALFLDESEPTYQEVSRRVGIPVASIGPTRARALAKLKRMLLRYSKDL